MERSVRLTRRAEKINFAVDDDADGKHYMCAIEKLVETMEVENRMN